MIMAIIPDVESQPKNRKFELEQVAIRMVRERPLYSETPIHSPEDAIRVMADALLDYDREVFAIVNFQSDMRPINFSIISMGCLNSSLVHPREVIKASILSNASGVMLFHNHPSGTVEPSKDDIITTDQLKNAFNLMGIRVLDHIIVGNDKSYYSLCEKDKLALPKRNYAETLDKLDLKHQKIDTPERNSVAEKELEEVSILNSDRNRNSVLSDLYACKSNMKTERSSKKTIKKKETVR